jgi:hypothetical protein
MVKQRNDLGVFGHLFVVTIQGTSGMEPLVYVCWEPFTDGGPDFAKGIPVGASNERECILYRSRYVVSSLRAAPDRDKGWGFVVPQAVWKASASRYVASLWA